MSERIIAECAAWGNAGAKYHTVRLVKSAGKYHVIILTYSGKILHDAFGTKSEAIEYMHEHMED